MKTVGAVLLTLVILIFVLFVGAIGTLNTEAALRASIQAHERTREASLDTMKKIINQKSQLPAAAKKDLLDLLPEVVSGRSGGSVFKTVQEQYPEFTMPLYLDLSRSIEAERRTFQREQESLFDVKREHDALLNSVVSGTLCQMFGRRPINVAVISSTATKQIIQSSVEDDIDLKL